MQLKILRRRPELFLILLQLTMLLVFLMGASKNNSCGAGMLLLLNHDHMFKLKMNCGFGSNTIAELLATPKMSYLLCGPY